MGTQILNPQNTKALLAQFTFKSGKEHRNTKKVVQFFGYGINFSLSHYLNTGPICPVFELIWNWISDVTGPPGIETKVHNIITRLNTRQAGIWIPTIFQSQNTSSL